jgi:amino acid transporter
VIGVPSSWLSQTVSDPLPSSRPCANVTPILTNVKTGMAEMVTYLPISSPFIRFADRYVDEAFGVAAGYNFFIFEAALVPFEIVACNLIIHYWSDAVPAGGIIAIVIICYG